MSFYLCQPTEYADLLITYIFVHRQRTTGLDHDRTHWIIHSDISRLVIAISLWRKVYAFQYLFLFSNVLITTLLKKTFRLNSRCKRLPNKNHLDHSKSWRMWNGPRRTLSVCHHRGLQGIPLESVISFNFSLGVIHKPRSHLRGRGSKNPRKKQCQLFEKWLHRGRVVKKSQFENHVRFVRMTFRFVKFD